MKKVNYEVAQTPQSDIISFTPQSITVTNDDPEKTKFDLIKSNDVPFTVPEPKVFTDDDRSLNKREVSNLQFIFEQILSGNTEALNRPEFSTLNFNNVIKAIEWLSKTDSLSDSLSMQLLTEGWRMSFKCKPPTPEEFLDTKYIGPSAETVRPFIKDLFIDFWDPVKPYRTLVLTPHIGWGKSFMSVMSQLYVSTHFAMMWHPYKYFGLSPATMFTQCLGGWNQKKASELLLEPFIQVLESSPYFQRVRTHGDILEKAQSDEVEDHLFWTTSTPTSALSMQNGVNYKVVQSPGAILGQTIIAAVISELTVFVDEGWTEEKIYKFFTKLRERIDSRMNGNYYGRFVLDSQPNTLESVIDKWIWEDAPKNPQNFIVSGARWKYFIQEFQDAYESTRNSWKDPLVLKKDFKHAFPIFKGGNGMPPQVVETEGHLSQFDPVDIVWAPWRSQTPSGSKDYHGAALENPIEFLRDQAGIPSGAADRIFYNPATIEHCFENNLRNMYAQITAPAEEEPEHLIWNQVRDLFFHKVVDRYYYYYEPGIPRVVSADQSYAGDVTCISMSHVERDPEKIDAETGEPLKVYVTDFTIVIIPKGGIINLDAIKFFIRDLKVLGNIKVKHASYDGFQSKAAQQALLRYGVDVEEVSVDKTNEPYLNFIDYVFHGRYFCGKNIYMKNNMKSLQMTKRKRTGTTKIDHMNGEIVTDGDGHWETDMRGVNAKDCCDAVAANIFLLNKYEKEFIPFKKWSATDSTDRSYETVKTKADTFLASMNLC